jgi:hypothetical protein
LKYNNEKVESFLTLFKYVDINRNPWIILRYQNVLQSKR